MPKNHPVKMNFTSGEISPKMLGRIDLDQYAAGAETLTNFLPVIWGGARFRPGFRFVSEVKNSADQTRLVPFEFSREQAYALEFGDQYVRFYKDNGVLLGLEVAVANHSFEIAGGGGADVFADWAETAGDGAIAMDTTIFQRGEASLKITTGASDNTQIRTNPDITHGMAAGESVTIKFHTQGDGTNAGEYRIYDVDNAVDITPWTTTGVTAAEWAQVSDTFVIPSGCLDIRIFFEASSGNGDFAYFDNVQFLNNEEPYEVATIYDEATINELQWTQSADVLYLVHPDYPPQKLLRYGDDDWDIETIVFIGPNLVDNGSMDADAFWTKGTGWDIALGVATCDGTQPGASGLAQSDRLELGVTYSVTFTVLNYSAGTITPFAGTQTGTPRSSNGEYQEDIVCGGNTNFTMQANATFVGDIDDVIVTATIFDTEGNYPRAICFFEERLFVAGTDLSPQTIWGSVSADYENFRTGTLADDAVVYTIASDQVNVINWITPSSNLFIGTAGGEFRATGGDQDIITPTSISIKSVSTNGAAPNVRPIRIGNIILFVQTAKKKIMEYKYSFQEDGFIGTNLSLISEHITGDGIKDIVWQKEPDSFVWGVREDGALVSMTYERNNNVIAWAAHVAGGTDADFKSLCVIPNPPGDADEIWCITERTIDGGTVQYVEYMDNGAYGLDSWIQYVEGSPETDFTGADHLEGETVKVVGDGARYPDVTISGGEFSIDIPATVVEIGLYYEGEIRTLIPNITGQEGMSFGFIQGWNVIRLLVTESQGGQINDQDLLLINPDDLMGDAPELYSGFLDVQETRWDDNGQFTIMQVYPFPFNVLLFTGSLSIADELGTGDNV